MEVTWRVKDKKLIIEVPLESILAARQHVTAKNGSMRFLPSELSKAEQRVFEHLVNPELGLKEIAELLGISHHTLKFHASNIYRKNHFSGSRSRFCLIQKFNEESKKS